MSRVKILVCCHKKEQFKSDDTYMPIHVGKRLSSEELGIQGDDQGDNISHKNASYCELTGMYWAWKNLKDVDYIGLCHYRRYFNFNDSGAFLSEFTVAEDIDDMNLELPDMEQLFKNTDVVLMKKSAFSKSVRAHYKYHQIKDFYCTEDVIREIYPDYTNSIEQVFSKSNKFSKCNMFIMKWAEFDRYCQWLFTILEEVERRTDISNYDARQMRVFGYLAERLINLYVHHNNLRVMYRPIYWINDISKMPSIAKRIERYVRVSIQFALKQLFARK